MHFYVNQEKRYSFNFLVHDLIDITIIGVPIKVGSSHITHTGSTEVFTNRKAVEVAIKEPPILLMCFNSQAPFTNCL